MREKDLTEIFLENGKKYCPYCSGKVEVLEEGEFGCQACHRVWGYGNDGELDWGIGYYHWKAETYRKVMKELILTEIGYKIDEMNGGELCDALHEANKSLDVMSIVDRLGGK